MSDLGKKPERASLAGNDLRASADAREYPMRLSDEALGQFLLELVSDALMRSGNAELWSDERFRRWKQRELRELGVSRGIGAEARAFAERAIGRMRAERANVDVSEGEPPWCEPTVHSTPGRVMDDALAIGAAPWMDLGAAAGAGRDIWDEAVDRWVKVPSTSPPGRYVAIRIVGDSMAPLMHSGDSVLVRVKAPLRVGRIVIARHPDDGYVCKLVHRVRTSTIELASIDATRPLITIPRDRSLVLGEVTMVWCTHGTRAGAPAV